MAVVTSSRPAVRARALGARGLLAVVAIVAGVVLFRTSYLGDRSAGDAETERVREVIARTISASPCLAPSAAIPTMRSALDASGHVDWQVRAGRDVAAMSCVTATLDGSRRQVILIPAMRPEVRERMQEVTMELYAQCLQRDAAIAYVRTALRELGETGFEIRTDGPISAPVDRQREVFDHVEQGCWVYSGAGWTPEGLRLYYVVGR